MARRSGPAHPNWKGGECFNTAQGRWVLSRNGKRVLRYRAVMEDHLGRPLRSDEHVHHINGDCTDDRLENLQILSNEEHQRQHGALRLQSVRLIFLMREAGFTHREIAAQIGVSQSAVTRRLQKGQVAA